MPRSSAAAGESAKESGWDNEVSLPGLAVVFEKGSLSLRKLQTFGVGLILMTILEVLAPSRFSIQLSRSDSG